MPVPKVGAHSITVCKGTCGRHVRPKRMAKEQAESLAQQLGIEGEVMANVNKGYCSTCWRAVSPALANQDPAPVAADKEARDARLAAERLALAEKARLALLEQRAARSQKRMVRSIHMGQSMVRI